MCAFEKATKKRTKMNHAWMVCSRRNMCFNPELILRTSHTRSRRHAKWKCTPNKNKMLMKFSVCSACCNWCTQQAHSACTSVTYSVPLYIVPTTLLPPPPPPPPQLVSSATMLSMLCSCSSLNVSPAPTCWLLWIAFHVPIRVKWAPENWLQSLRNKANNPQAAL